MAAAVAAVVFIGGYGCYIMIVAVILNGRHGDFFYVAGNFMGMGNGRHCQDGKCQHHQKADPFFQHFCNLQHDRGCVKATQANYAGSQKRPNPIKP